LGVFLLPATLAGTARPVSIPGVDIHRRGRDPLSPRPRRHQPLDAAHGRPYAYARRAFGEFIGFQTAWGYWIAVWAGNAAIAVAFVAYATVFWAELGDNNLHAALVGIGLIWVLTLTNALGTRESGIVQVVTTMLKCVPLAVLGLIGLFFIDGGSYEPFAPEGTWTAISAAVPLTLCAFIGLESAAVPAEEVRDPRAHDPARRSSARSLRRCSTSSRRSRSWASCRRPVPARW